MRERSGQYPNLAKMEGNEEKSKCDGDSSDGDCKGTPTQPRRNSVQREREAKKTLSDEKLVSRGDEEGSIFALVGNVMKLMNGSGLFLSSWRSP